jgi:hypothetical protein
MAELKTNRTVERLHSYIPFNPSHAEIYEEHQKESFVHADTAAEVWLADRLKRGEQPTSLVVLTGDAGHGKTHLVRHLLKRLGWEEDLSEVLQYRCKGEPLNIGEYTLAIHKDLSEMDPPEAAALLKSTEELPHPLIVCVNEGRLRAMLSSEALRNTALAEQVFKALHEDIIEPAEGVVVLNLNWQMVSLPAGIMTTLLGQLLDGRKWRACGSCDAAPRCPIFQNRSILSDMEHRVEAIRRLYEIVEQLGEVVTIRQVMIHLAWLLTGNLVCEDVHKMRSSRDLSGFSHTSNLFGEGAPELFISSHGLFARLQKLDPAWSASREIDDHLATDEGRACIPENAPDRKHTTRWRQVDLRKELSPHNFDVDARNHLEQESAILERSFAILRRNHLLEQAREDGSRITIAGFEHIQDFQDLLHERLKRLPRKRIINRVIEGLHRLQYLPKPDGNGLYIVDPVSLRARAPTAVIAMQVPTREVSLDPEQPPRPEKGDLPALDAEPRRLWLTIRSHRLGLDLWSFEFLCRCGSGLASRMFFAREARRITNFLLKVAQSEEQDSPDSARVLFQGKVISLSVEDGVISCD